MTKMYKPNKHHGNGQSRSENVWRDPRTGIRMAPGAIRNWPTEHELKNMAQWHYRAAQDKRAAMARAVKEQVAKLYNQKNSSPPNDPLCYL